jgi:hypothetical protein
MNPSPVDADTRSVVSRSMKHALVEVDPESVGQLIARVLREAHHTAEVLNAPNEARAILDVAHSFADELADADPQFDRLGFIRAATDRL